jgi:hypothetical protein
MLREVRHVYALLACWGQSAGRRGRASGAGPMVVVALQAMDALNIGMADVGGVSWAG